MGKFTKIALAVWFAGIITLIALIYYTTTIYDHDIYVVVKPVNITGTQQYHMLGSTLFLSYRGYTIQQPLLLHYNPAQIIINNLYAPLFIIWVVVGLLVVVIIKLAEDEG